MSINVNITIEGRFEKKVRDLEKLMRGAGFTTSGNRYTRGTVTVLVSESNIKVTLDSGQMKLFKGTLDQILQTVKAETTRVSGLK